MAGALAEGGLEVVRTHEPGGTPLGDLVSQVVRRGRLARRLYAALTEDGAWTGLDPIAELFLFAAARAQSMREVVRPAMERGAVVLSDRFVASTLAYQGYGRGLPLDDIREVNRMATGSLEADLTILLDAPPSVGLTRESDDPSSDRLRAETLAFHERVRAGYLEMARAAPSRWVVLDASEPPDAVLRSALDAIRPLLRQTT